MMRSVRLNLALATFLALGACSQKANSSADPVATEDVATSQVQASPIPSEAAEAAPTETPLRIMSKAEMDARLREQMIPQKDRAENEDPS